MKRETWTTTHGHLLQMGGIRLSATRHEEMLAYSDDELNDCHRLHRYRHRTQEGSWTISYDPFFRHPMDCICESVLTFDALKRFLSENLLTFPTITEDEIDDRSKGDALAKGFALLQITWFIFQIITRAVQGLAITELELTTAALAGLNSAMYIFWWDKPCHVQFPVVIRTKGVEELLAKEPAKDVARSFSEDTFDFRKHLWMSMDKTIRWPFNAFVQAFAYALQIVNVVFSSFSGVVKAVRHKISFSFSQIRRHFAQSGVVEKDESLKHNTSRGSKDSQDDLNASREPMNSETIDITCAMSPTRSSTDYTHKKVCFMIISNPLAF